MSPAPDLEPLPPEPPSWPGSPARLGELYAHVVTFAEAVTAILERAERGHGGFVVTPNVDHVCRAERDKALVVAYRDACLSVVDGTPLLWLARLSGTPLPEKVSGSDLALPLLEGAAARQLRVYFLGSTPETAARAQRRLEAQFPALQIVGTDQPHFDPDASPEAIAPAIERLRLARPQLVFVAFGNPKQELFMQRYAATVPGAVFLGLGGVLDFLAGDLRRAPVALQKAGLEWAWRLALQPRRLWRRYLVDDRAFAGIAARQIRQARRDRTRRGDGDSDSAWRTDHPGRSPAPRSRVPAARGR